MKDIKFKARFLEENIYADHADHDIVTPIQITIKEEDLDNLRDKLTTELVEEIEKYVLDEIRKHCSNRFLGSSAGRAGDC